MPRYDGIDLWVCGLALVGVSPCGVEIGWR